MENTTKRILTYSSNFDKEIKNDKYIELGEEYTKELAKESLEHIRIIDATLKTKA